MTRKEKQNMWLSQYKPALICTTDESQKQDTPGESQKQDTPGERQSQWETVVEAGESRRLKYCYTRLYLASGCERQVRSSFGFKLTQSAARVHSPLLIERVLTLLCAAYLVQFQFQGW